MPAPLGKTPTKKLPKIEVWGLGDSRSTRAAVRFFRERRIVVTFVDLGKRAMDPAELRQFMDRLGDRLFEAPAEPATAATAATATTDRGALLTRLRSNPSLLRLPIVRHGDELTAGQDEAAWKAWLARRNR